MNPPDDGPQVPSGDKFPVEEDGAATDELALLGTTKLERLIDDKAEALYDGVATVLIWLAIEDIADDMADD